MVENVLTYVLQLQDKLSPALKNTGGNVDALQTKISALKAQRQWINPNNKQALASIDKEINRLESDLGKLESKSQKVSLFDKVGNAALRLTGIVGIAQSAFGSLSNAISKCTQANQEDGIASARLAVTMRNAMGASAEQTADIEKLTLAQEKLGVVSGGTQVAGAQELSTYLGKTQSLKTLIPVMNDMLAQQYGLNATQESAVQIGSMLGKVMQGQTGALSRYGYSFTQAQEQILKFGTEEERVATLADVVSSSVSGVNKALAETDAGKLVIAQNRFGGIQSAVGALVEKIKAALLPAADVLMKYLEQAMLWVESHIKDITNFVMGVADALAGVFTFIAENFSLITTLAAIIASIVVAYKAWTAAQWLLNVAMDANPLGLIIIAVGALIGLVAVLVDKYDEWGAALSIVCGQIGIIVNVIMTIKRYWNSITESFSNGGFVAGIKQIGVALLDCIMYPLQQLFNQLARIPGMGKIGTELWKAQVEMRKRLGAIDPEKPTSSENQEKPTTFEDIVNQSKNVHFVGDLENATKMDKAAKTTESVATGGTKNTQITINLEKFFDNIIYEQGGVDDNAQNTLDKFAEMLRRTLYAAQTAV